MGIFRVQVFPLWEHIIFDGSRNRWKSGECQTSQSANMFITIRHSLVWWIVHRCVHANSDWAIRIRLYIWLVVWNISYFSIYWVIIIPTDFHMLQRGSYTTNQTGFHSMALQLIEDMDFTKWVSDLQNKNCRWLAVTILEIRAGRFGRNFRGARALRGQHHL
jgi:hypothetical protein